MDESAEAFESPNGPVTPGTPSGSARNRRTTNKDGLKLTNSGRVSMSGNKVNEKYNASYRNSENTNRLLGRLLTLGQACGIVGVALYGADIPMEESGILKHILHILYILIFKLCILHILHIQYVFLGAGHTDRLHILKSAAFYALTDEELEEILACDSEPVLKAYVMGVFRAAVRLWKFVMPVAAKDVFQTKVFHPATVSPVLQSHLGLTLAERIFDKYVLIMLSDIYCIFDIFDIFSVGQARATSTSAPHRNPKQSRMTKGRRGLKGQ
jgi:hypothetical protein